MQVVGYARVSTGDQIRDGVRIAAQQVTIEACAMVEDWALLELILDEGQNAKPRKRPALERPLTLVERRRVEAVLVDTLDRLTRSGADLDKRMTRCERTGVAFVSLPESLDATTATGRLMMNLLASVSQWERGGIGGCTRDAMPRLKAQGTRDGYAVFGEGPGEAAILAWMHAERRAGRSSETSAEGLHAAGAPTVTLGGRWLGNPLRRMLLRTSPTPTRHEGRSTTAHPRTPEATDAAGTDRHALASP